MKTTGHAVAAAMALLILAGCSGGEDDAAQSDAGAAGEQAGTGGQAGAAAGPALAVEADKTHAVQPSDEITLTISVSDFTLDADETGAGEKAGVGHYRVYLDDAAGENYLFAGDAPTAKVTVPADITDGSHELRVALYANDGTPIEPPVQTSVLLIVYRL